VSADNGGWFFAFKTVAETLAVPVSALATSPASPAFASASRSAAPLSVPLRAFTTSTLTMAGTTYTFRLGYAHPNLVVTPTRDATADHLEGYVSCDGGVFLHANGVDGSYGFHSAQTLDSTFIVFNLRTSDPDTLDFEGVAYDSSFALVHSTITPGKGRMWFFDNVMFYSIRIPKNRAATNPYPTGGSVDWLLQASALNSPSSNDYAYFLTPDVLMTFDGSHVATLSISDGFYAPAYLWRYSLNLDSGVVQRLN